ncbi:hypothetical protein D3C77_321710 [compost metagenome]
MPLFVFGIDPHCLEHAAYRAYGALGLVNRDRLMDQGSLLVLAICRFPALDLHGPGQPWQKVGRAARRVRYAADNVWVDTTLAGQLDRLLQEGGVAWQQTHPSTSVVSSIPLQLG